MTDHRGMRRLLVSLAIAGAPGWIAAVSVAGPGDPSEAGIARPVAATPATALIAGP